LRFGIETLAQGAMMLEKILEKISA